MLDAPEVWLLAAGSAFPGPPIDNARLAELFGADDLWQQWVEVFLGTRTRHFAVDLETNEVRHSLADLGRTAAERALAGAGLAAADVDVIVLATSMPDHLMPTTVNVVADRLGIDGVPTFQLQSGCTGAVQALQVARQALVAGGHRTALVIGGDVCAKFLDVDLAPGKVKAADLVNIAMFGDAAGAAVLSTDPTPDAVAVRRLDLRLAGLGRESGHTVQWSGTARRDSDGPAVAEDYKAIEEIVPRMAVETARRVLDELGWADSRVDYLLPPQLSGRMTAKIVERLGLPGAKEISCVRETGNTGNALPFLQLERLLPLVGPGQCVLGVAIESSKWIQSAFALERPGAGVGL
ncbi:3-oxoacyl-[acyl-carrier-protein] synthase-3 [Catenulispora sp. MAP5-51]|uniref:3-oxoacyl-ACP synthase III family protein n=1 Tax=Catenulispora sp. MAP5-51 TaxID=3156298 RepID=UPI003517BC6B